MVLVDPCVRVADEADMARGEIREAAERVVEPAVAASSESALMVKSRRRASARKSRPKATFARRPSVSTSARRVVVSIGRPSLIRGHGAVVDPRRRDLETRGLGARDRLGRDGGGGEVEIARLEAEREIADRAADDPRLVAAAVERRERAGERLAAERSAGPQRGPPRRPRKAGHSKGPGTSTPFSRCAGTYAPWPRGADRLTTRGRGWRPRARRGSGSRPDRASSVRPRADSGRAGPDRARRPGTGQEQRQRLEDRAQHQE